MRFAWFLGISGLIPFIAGLILTLSGDVSSPVVEGLALDGPRVMLSYGAIILSFMGAIHWGTALEREPDRAWPYGVSVVPALYGWLIWGLSLLNPTDSGLLMIALGLGFVILLVFDLVRGQAGDFPKWYPRLRVLLTIGAAGTLALAGVYST